MSKTKNDDAKKSPEEAEMVKRIDAMMSPNDAPDPATSAPVDPSVNAKNTPEPQPEIDIFKEMKTAPEVSPSLLKKIGGTKSTPKSNEAIVASASATAEPKPAAEPETKPAIVSHEAKTIKPLSNETDSTPASETEKSEPLPITDQDPYADESTDKAVEDIVATESDEILAAEDILKNSSAQPIAAKKPSKTKKTRRISFAWLKTKKGFAGALLLLLIIIFAVPASRYTVLGLAIKKPVNIRVMDSTTNTPVSNAKVSLGGASAQTNEKGVASLSAKPGKQTLIIEKRYYRVYQTSQFVGLAAAPNVSAKLVATGRQVPVIVTDKVSGKPLGGVEISVLKTSAKTDNKGKATIVLPADAPSSSAQIAAAGFNNQKVTITITDKVVAENTFSMTPRGKLYFLSNQAGTIDVVSTNLDGSERKVVLAGTGKEDARTTSLLASRDWKYVVLKARRDTAQPSLYVIDTSTNKLRQFESGVAEYELVGWNGHNFIYDVVVTSKSRWQAGRELLKSYDAERGDLNQLDQNLAEGDANRYAYQSFYNFYILENSVAYTTQWSTYDNTGSYDLGNKNASIRAVSPAGQNKKDYQTFAASTYPYFQAALFEPQAIYYAVGTPNDGKTLYYEFEDKKVSQKNDIDAGAFNKLYPTYLISPNGKQSFWTELRDGKDSLLIGDAQATNKKVIATLSDYAPYGWHSDKYLLVSKNNSELYILPANGLDSGKSPMKITDYYKPAQSFTGYGYGYGGL